MAAHVLSRIVGGAILATGGWALAEFVADVWWPEQYLFLVVGLAIVGAAVGMAATPFVTRRVYRSIAEQTRGLPASRLLSSIAGMVLGLTVALNPVAWGVLGVNTMDAQLKGRKFDRKVYVGHVLVDAANVDRFLPKKKK